MEMFSGDTEGSTEDVPGRKKSKLTSLKTRLFRKSKKAEDTTSRKLSQSASDITAGEGLGSDEDLVCIQGIMGSRALSHDSIFLADQALTETEPTRVLSQENVHSKIKALQEKLQQQKLHFGLPPMVLPIRCPEDQMSRSEEDVHSPLEMAEGHIATQEALNKALSQLSPNPVLPTSKTALNKPLHPVLSAPLKPTSPNDEAPLDFSTPPQFTRSLDTSAARHRVSVKPRNQRAITKKRLLAVDSTSRIPDMNNSETLEEEDGEPVVQEEDVEAVNIKFPQTTAVPSEPTKLEPTSKSPQQDIGNLGELPTVTSHILRPKPHRSADVSPAVRPHSSFIPSEVKGKSESSVNFDIQFLKDSQNKSWNTDIKSKLASSDQQSTDPGSVLQTIVVHGETDRTSAIRRPFPGSDSFNLSEEERPRAGSFTGVREHAWIKEKRLDTSSPNISQKVDLKPSGESIDVGRFRQESAQDKRWDTKDTFRKMESVRQSKNKIADTNDSAEAGKGVEEEEGKTTFGIKLRSTSQSVRLRAEVASNENTEVTEEKQQKQEIQQMSQKAPITGEAKPDVSTATSAANVPTQSHGTTPLVSTEGQSLPSNPTQGKAAPQASSTEVSWMSMAMLKTKSLHSLFTGKFPKDLTGAKTAARSQKPQVQTLNQAQVDTQSIKSTTQLTSDAGRTEQNKTQGETVKQSLLAATAQQQTLKTSFVKPDISKEAQISKTTENESQKTSTEPPPQFVTQTASQTNIWTNQSPLRSIRQLESTPQSSSPSGHQPPWSTRSLRSTGLVSTPCAQEAAADSENNAANVQEKEGQPVWARSVSKKAAFLERRAEWTSSPVEVKKLEIVTTSETLAQPKVQSKDPKAGSETKHTESSPRKIPERPREDWLRKTAAPSLSPTSSSTLSSSLQSDSGQPSWMELAKRKSMAWSDKTMD